MQSTIATRLKGLLLERGITQKKLADMIHCTEGAVCRYLQGEREPRIGIITKVCDIFEVSADYLLRGTPDIKKPRIKVKRGKIKCTLH